MNANPMEEQIGRLVGNLLAGGGEIFLPGVGSLYTERQGARRLNRRTVLPPASRMTRAISSTSDTPRCCEVKATVRLGGSTVRRLSRLAPCRSV